MARGRIISKTLSTSQKRAALHQVVPDLAEFCQQLYPLLVAHADDWGRLQGDAFTVKHAIDPTSPRPLASFETGLEALHTVRLIDWYRVDGRMFIQILNFDPHQPNLHKRTSSGFPEPPGSPPEIPNASGSGPEIHSELNGIEVNRREGNGPAPPALPGSSRTTPLIARRRGSAAFEGPRGLYVPQRLHQQFVGLRNHAGAEAELNGWYERVCLQWSEGTRRTENPDPDMFRFWNARFSEEWPTSKGQAPGPSGPDAAAKLAKAKYGDMRFGQ